MYTCDVEFGVALEGPFVPNGLQALSSLKGRLSGGKLPRAPATQRRRSPGWSVGPLRLLFVALYVCGLHLCSSRRSSVGLVVFVVARHLPLLISLCRLVAGARSALDSSVDPGRRGGSLSGDRSDESPKRRNRSPDPDIPGNQEISRRPGQPRRREAQRDELPLCRTRPW